MSSTQYRYYIIRTIPRCEHQNKHLVFLRTSVKFDKGQPSLKPLTLDHLKNNPEKRFPKPIPVTVVERWYSRYSHAPTYFYDNKMNYEPNEVFIRLIGRWEDTGYDTINKAKYRFMNNTDDGTVVTLEPLDADEITWNAPCPKCKNVGCEECNKNPFSVFNLVTRKLIGKPDVNGDLVVDIKRKP